MPEPKRRLKEVHLFSSVKEIQDYAAIIPANALSGSYERCTHTINRLYAEAVKEDEQGDEEKAYVYFARTCTLLFQFREKCKKDRSSGEDARMWELLFGYLLNRSLVRARELVSSLQARYAAAASTDYCIDLTVDAEEEIEPDVVAETNEIYDSTGTLRLINWSDLRQLIALDEKDILIIDVRDSEEFLANRIFLNRGSMVNIPPHLITPGLTSRSLEMKLKPHDRLVFRKRSRVEHVVILDKSFDPSRPPSETLMNLNDALVQFDQCFWEKKPRYLVGGFKTWSNYYPTCCTMEYSSNGSPAMTLSDLTGEISEKLMIDYPPVITEEDVIDLASEEPTVAMEEPRPRKMVRVGAPKINRKLKPRAGPPSIAQSQAERQEAGSANDKYHLRSRLIDGIASEHPSTAELEDKKEPTDAKRPAKRQPVTSVSRKNTSNHAADMQKTQSTGEFGPPVPKVPAVPDRQTKPTVAQRRKNEKREMVVISKSVGFTEKSPVDRRGPSMVGLINLGCTCYMNSVVQVLFRTTMLRSYFASKNFDVDLEYLRDRGCSMTIAMECKNLFELLTQKNCEPVAPIGFREVIQQQSGMFEDNVQQDAQEFMVFLLDALHEDLNMGKLVENGNPPTDEELNRTGGDAYWSYYVERNRSVIVDLFQGLCRSTTVCQKCMYTSSKYDVYMHFSLPVAATGKSTLQQCLASFAKQEHLSQQVGWRCDRCKAKRAAVRRDRLVRAPIMLLVHLKRFTHNGAETGKIETTVDFPVSEPLDVSAIAEPGSSASSHRYLLAAVINHEGSASCGHYYSFCHDFVSGEWVRCDDEQLAVVKSSSVQSKNAYLLFYLSEEFARTELDGNK